MIYIKSSIRAKFPMRITPDRQGVLLCFMASLLFSASFCFGNDNTIEVIGFGECVVCKQSNIKTSHALSGLHVTIDCKVADGRFKTRGYGKLDEEGKFKVKIPNEIILKDGKLKEECYAQLHSASATPCPAYNGIESSKIVFKSLIDGKLKFGLTNKLKFSPVTCTSAFLWPYFKYSPIPKLPPLKTFPPFPPKVFPPFTPEVFPPPVPIFKPLPPPIPVYKKPLPPPVPINVKPLPPPVPIYKKPQPPPVPVYKEPLPPPGPVYKKPQPPPVPIYKKPFPPIYNKPKPPPKRVSKEPTLPPHVPIYKPKPPVYKPPKIYPPRIPIYKPPVPKILPPPVPVFEKPVSHPIPVYKPKPLLLFPRIPIPRLPKVPRLPRSPFLRNTPPPQYPKFGTLSPFPHLSPHH